MIIVQLFGGLGNQMFQYALARSLSLDRETSFKLDITAYYSNIPALDTPRRYSLSVFNIYEELATKEEIEKFLGKKKIFIKIKYQLNKHFHFNFFEKIFMESDYGYNSSVKKVGTDAYLFGFWQSWKYFSKHSKTIKKDFKLREPLSKSAQLWLKKIEKLNSISVHIRRTDMAHNKHTRAYHGICSLNYYQKAIKLVHQENPKITLFIFSDDIKWAKDNLRTNFKTYFVSQTKDLKDYEEMTLMSRCKHNIIANSSFSWWGAWLNDNPQKIVIVPKKWFQNPSINTKDLIPEQWLRI
ncbi:MAG: alpha-1,2-fucosyltransferase [Patescibacteria group bacterium]|nr:alpha-1,2-fucosyltransferase [Patescibacteria group bacterium]